MQADAIFRHLVEFEFLQRNHQLPRFYFRNVEDIVEQHHHRTSRAYDHLGVTCCLLVEIHLAQQVRKAEHAVHGRSYLVAHVREKLCLGPCRIFRVAGCALQLPLQLDPHGNVTSRNDYAFTQTALTIACDSAIRLEVYRVSVLVVDQAAIGKSFGFRFPGRQTVQDTRNGVARFRVRAFGRRRSDKDGRWCAEYARDRGGSICAPPLQIVSQDGIRDIVRQQSQLLPT